MKDVAAWIVAIVIGGILSAFLFRMTYAEGQRDERAKWHAERDSLTTANNLITLRFDSARAESIAHEQRAESLATVPRTIYITNATRLTSGASLDSLGILFFADPFTAVPDTIIDHHEP